MDFFTLRASNLPLAVILLLILKPINPQTTDADPTVEWSKETTENSNYYVYEEPKKQEKDTNIMFINQKRNESHNTFHYYRVNDEHRVNDQKNKSEQFTVNGTKSDRSSKVDANVDRNEFKTPRVKEKGFNSRDDGGMNDYVEYSTLDDSVKAGVHLDEKHPCLRECGEEEEPMICYYKFNIEWYQTMSKACYDCPHIEADCFRPDCIPADGISRTVTVVNRKMPGPSIEVCHNDKIIVDVENSMMTEATTVHWHGQHQKESPFMDGTPFVTQCPISAESTFRYQFKAAQSGTHFWHSHSGMQRADGAAGPLIVRRPLIHEPHAELYDYDLSEHIMTVTDWVHELSIAMFADHHHSEGDNKPPTLLINGLGRFLQFQNNVTNDTYYMRAARFNVEQGYRYRFRVINAEFLNCPIELSIDNHNLTIIQSDGYDVEPFTTTSLVTYAGERFDFVVSADQEIDNYWIRFRGLMDCDERFTKAKQVAVFHYEGALDIEPEGELTWEDSHNEGLQVNALNKGTEDDETVSLAKLRAMAEDDDSLKEHPDYTFYVAYDFYPKNNTHFHKSPYYGYYQVPKQDNRLYTPQLNHITLKQSASPLLISKPASSHFCNSSSIPESCVEGFCECKHVLEVKLNSIVEVIIIDEGVTFDANHPFHLHGHPFRVVAMKRLATEITVDEVKQYDAEGKLERNLHKAPIKDTITVPDGGYTVIRFKADNPGYWLFHCHIEFHAEVGMALVFKVGEHNQMMPLPRNFPTCGDFLGDDDDDLNGSDKIIINEVWPVENEIHSAGNKIEIGWGINLILMTFFTMLLL